MKNRNATVPKNPGNAAMFETGIAWRLCGKDIFIQAEAAQTSIPSATEHVPTKEMTFTPAMFRIQDKPRTNGVIADTAVIFVTVAAVAAGNIATAVSEMNNMYETVIPKQVTTFKVLFKFSPNVPKATFVNPAYVETSCAVAALFKTTTSCAATSIRNVSNDNTKDDNKHAVTKTEPPCANAHGKANPPAPKIALIVFMTAAFSPEASAVAVAFVTVEIILLLLLLLLLLFECRNMLWLLFFLLFVFESEGTMIKSMFVCMARFLFFSSYRFSPILVDREQLLDLLLFLIIEDGERARVCIIVRSVVVVVVVSARTRDG